MKTLIAVPTLNTAYIPFTTSIISLEKPPETAISFETDSLVYMARNRLAMTAIEGGYDYILWVDSDMSFPADALVRLLKRAGEGKQYISGLYFRRKYPMAPVISKSLVWGQDPNTREITSHTDIFMDYPRDSVFKIAAAGLGLCLMSTEIVKAAASAFRMSPFNPLPAMGEDYSFCWRLAQIGVDMWCDSSVKADHVGTFVFNEARFLEQEARK